MNEQNLLIDCMGFYAVSAIFQPYNGGEFTQTVYINLKDCGLIVQGSDLQFN